MTALDYVVIALYFLVLFGIAWWAIKRERTGDQTSDDYFLAGRNVGWFVVGASLFASNIGSEHLVGLAGAGASSGVVLGQFELQASLILLLLGWLFVPFYIKSGVYTMPEFLERRYSPAARWYLAVISIIGYILTKISVTIYAGGVIFEALMGINFWTGAVTIVVVTGLYTIFGGLLAVVYTDMLQAIVLLFGALCVTVFGLIEVGGWNVMVETAGSGMMNLWKPITDPNFPWTGMVFGAPIIAVWYWCTDQYIVQRTLAARNITHARRGTIFGGFLKQLPLFIFVIPGIIAYALVQQDQLVLGQADEALPTLVAALLPVGLRGLVAAGLLAALMSSLSSVFNSCSTLITLDVYKKLHPGASERQLVWVGQLATAALVVLGLAWIPMMSGISGVLYEYLQSVQGYISPPIAAVFLLGLFWRRLNAVGAITSLLGGSAIGLLRLVAELNKDALDGILYTFANINFLHFAALLFLVCALLLIVVSLLTPAPPPEKVVGLTYETAEQKKQRTTTAKHQDEAPIEFPQMEDTPKARQKDKIYSAILLIIVAAVMLYFTG
jgi:SSS family solute:Na+ symporter